MSAWPPDPLAALDHREEQIATLLSRGWSYSRIAACIGIKESTVASYARNAAGKFENPERIAPQLLLALWAARRAWEKDAA